MLDIVAAQQHQLALPVHLEHIDNAKAWLARTGNLSGELEAATGDAPQDQPRDNHQQKH